jgi:hypothetical protein
MVGAVWITWIIALALGAFAVVESLPTNLANAGFSAVDLLLVLSTVTVGAVLVIRLPRHIVGWLLLVGGVSLAVSLGTQALADYGLNVRPGSVPNAVWFAVISGAAGGSFIGLLAGLVPFYFPTGRPPSPRWRVVPFIAIVPTVAPGIFTALSPFSPGTFPAEVVNPLALGGAGAQLLAVLNPISNVLGLVAFVLVIASLVVRYRRAAGVERAQLKWFVVAGLFVVPTFMVAILTSSFTTGPLAIVTNVAWPLGIFSLAFLPVAIGLAILRYRLYEIDRLISRSISWAILSLGLGGLFVALILGAQAFLAPFTGSNELAVAGSTLLVAALFQPVRRRVQRLVDRRFNRARYDAERTVAAFAGRLRDEVDFERLRTEILNTVTQTVEPTSVSLWLRT